MRNKFIINGRIVRNKYEICEDLVKIYCKHKGEEKVVLIDLDDLERVLNLDIALQIKSNYDGLNYYCTYRKDGKTIRLHRYIMNCTDPEVIIDHKNNDGLDNRKSNLRLVDKLVNGQNRRGLQRNNTSGVTGVYWIDRLKKYEVSITVNRKKINLGYEADIDKAVQVRKEAEIKYFISKEDE